MMQESLATANKGRAYSTDFAEHQGLLSKMAYKGYLRLQQAGVATEYDEVFQEMSLIYCKAASHYDPSKGFTFSAYLGQAIWHDFNKYAEKLITDRCGEVATKETYDEFDAKRAEVSGVKYDKKVKRTGRFNGTVSIESLTADSDDSGMSMYEVIGSDVQTPEEQYINSRSFIDAMKSLPSTERIIVGAMIRTVIRPRNGEEQQDKSLAEIMRDMNLTRQQSVRARELIGKAFGVNLKGTK